MPHPSHVTAAAYTSAGKGASLKMTRFGTLLKVCQKSSGEAGNAVATGGCPSSTMRPSLCALSALRGTSGGATMTVPGGARTTLRTAYCCTHVRGTPASIMGRSSHATGLRPFALPRADPLSPPPSRSLVCAYTTNNARRYGHLLAGGPGPIGVGQSGLPTSHSGDSANFALHDFCELRGDGVLRSSRLQSPPA